MQGTPEHPKAPLGNNFRPPQPLLHRPVRTNIDFRTKQNGKLCPSMYRDVHYKGKKRKWIFKLKKVHIFIDFLLTFSPPLSFSLDTGKQLNKLSTEILQLLTNVPFMAFSFSFFIKCVHCSRFSEHSRKRHHLQQQQRHKFN